MRSCLYTGWVRHRRARPTVHDFRYPATLFYLDLDELERVGPSLRLFGVNRAGLFSFRDRDHMDGEPGATRPKLERWLSRHDVDVTGGRIGLLTSCRLFGYVFNPVSFYYCHAVSGELRAVVAEVSSTFGERYLYLLRDEAGREPWRCSATKQMHVSPFLSNRCRYDFRLAPLRERLSIGIVEFEDDQHVLDAQLWGERRSLDDGALARLALTQPWLTLRTTVAIHHQALRLYFKRVPVVSQPAPSDAQRRQAEELGRRVF